MYVAEKEKGSFYTIKPVQGKEVRAVASNPYTFVNEHWKELGEEEFYIAYEYDLDNPDKPSKRMEFIMERDGIK